MLSFARRIRKRDSQKPRASGKHILVKKEGTEEMKNIKRISALVLALIMVLALTATALADDATMAGQEGVIGEFTTPDTPVTQTDTVVIYKEITAYNPEACTVNAPTVTYNYTIGAATVATGTTVTDNASHHAQINSTNVNAQVAVKAGVGTPTITGTAAGVLAITPANQLSASQYGTANRFNLTVDFSSIDWATTGTGAGVYRYVITETTNATDKNAAGIAEGTIAKTLYMDVYVDGSGNIYGYTLFSNNSSIDATAGDDAAKTAAGKTEGFVDDPANTVYTSSNTSAADKYYTFNLTLTKVVANDAYAVTTHHQFPFTVNLDNATVTAAVLPIMTVGTNATQTALTAFVIGHNDTANNSDTSTTWTPTIADNATVTYVGIPCGTTITVKETNDVTGVTYNSVSTNADTNAAAKAINTGDASNVATIDCNATALTAAAENHTAAASKVVTFTNTMIQISPTGVTLRVAPFALMLFAGIALVLITRRRENTEEA